MTPKEFLETLDNSMALKTAEWLHEQITSNRDLVILDLRSNDIWKESHVSGSIQVSINELPGKAGNLIPSKGTTVACLCGGSIQSAMAVMYLRTEDYSSSFNISGGFSAWSRKALPVKSC